MLHYRLRQWTLTSASRAISAVAELLVLEGWRSRPGWGDAQRQITDEVRSENWRRSPFPVAGHNRRKKMKLKFYVQISAFLHCSYFTLLLQLLFTQYTLAEKWIIIPRLNAYDYRYCINIAKQTYFELVEFVLSLLCLSRTVDCFRKYFICIRWQGSILFSLINVWHANKTINDSGTLYWRCHKTRTRLTQDIVAFVSVMEGYGLRRYARQTAEQSSGNIHCRPTCTVSPKRPPC